MSSLFAQKPFFAKKTVWQMFQPYSFSFFGFIYIMLNKLSTD